VVIVQLADGGLISYRKPDGRYLHTLATPEAFERKLGQLRCEPEQTGPTVIMSDVALSLCEALKPKTMRPLGHEVFAPHRADSHPGVAARFRDRPPAKKAAWELALMKWSMTRMRLSFTSRTWSAMKAHSPPSPRR
jgi:hypothetical protein